MTKKVKQNGSVNKGTKYDETQIERVKRMEEILKKSSEAVLDLKQALERYAALTDDIRELEQYYSGGQWQTDFADDETGKLPNDLKRGVLSEDTVYNFLALRDEVLAKIKNIN
jgi:hypothetical protein